MLDLTILAKTRKAGEEELGRLQGRPGFLPALLIVARAGQELPDPLRILAAVHLKNTLQKQWSRKDSFSNEDRAEIKSRILQSLAEPIQQVSAQLNLGLASIARAEWPRAWPDLFPALSSLIDERDLLKTRRGLQATLSVLKELNTKRLPTDKQQFRDLCVHLIDGVHNLWSQQVSIMLSRGAEQDSLENRERGEVVLAASKIMHVLVAYGWSEETFASGPQPRVLFQELCTSPIEQSLLQLCYAASTMRTDPTLNSRARPLIQSTTKTLRALFRLVNDAQEKKPLGFVPYLQPVLEKTYQNSIMFMQNTPCLVTHNQQGFFDEKLAVLSVTMLANVINCNEYKLTSSAEEPRGSGKLITAQGDVEESGTTNSAQAAHQLLSQFWSNERIHEVVRGIVMRAMVLSDEDIEEWESSPEEFALREEEQSATRTFRPACENLMLALMDTYPDPTSSVLLDMLKETENSEIINGSGMSDAAALREAVYGAIGICAYWLYEKLPFRKWLEQSLFPLLGDSREHLAINLLRSRILWLLGCIPSESYEDKQDALYEFLLSLTENSNTDLVVRIQAMRAIQRLLESWCFQAQLFEPYQTRAIRAAMTLSSTCELSSTHQGIINTVSVLVTRVEENILRSLPDLLQPISTLWGRHEGSEWSLWKIAVLQLLQNVAEKIGEAENLDAERKYNIILELQELLLPLVAACTDTQNPDFVYLGEPAVDLWAAIAKSTARYTPGMHALTQRLPSLLSAFGTDVAFFARIVDIFEAHLLSAADDIVRDFGNSTLLPLFDNYVARGYLKDQQEMRLLRSLEILLRTRSQNVPTILTPVFQRIASTVLENKSAVLGQQLHVTYLTILARFVFEYGTQALCNAVPGIPMLRLIDEWLSSYKDIGGSAFGIWRRKLWALVLCSQLTDTLARQPWSNVDLSTLQADQHRFSSVLHVWADIRADLHSDLQREVASQRLLEALGAGKPQDGSSLSNFYQRKKDSFWADRVVTLELDDAMRSTLRECSKIIPETALRPLVEADAAVSSLF